MKTIRYCLQSAHYAGIKLHPQKEVERLGMVVLAFEGVPIADCVMIVVESVPDVLPDYISLSTYQLVEHANLYRTDKINNLM